MSENMIESGIENQGSLINKVNDNYCIKTNVLHFVLFVLFLCIFIYLYLKKYNTEIKLTEYIYGGDSVLKEKKQLVRQKLVDLKNNIKEKTKGLNKIATHFSKEKQKPIHENIDSIIEDNKIYASIEFTNMINNIGDIRTHLSSELSTVDNIVKRFNELNTHYKNLEYERNKIIQLRKREQKLKEQHDDIRIDENIDDLIDKEMYADQYINNITGEIESIKSKLKLHLDTLNKLKKELYVKIKVLKFMVNFHKKTKSIPTIDVIHNYEIKLNTLDTLNAKVAKLDVHKLIEE